MDYFDISEIDVRDKRERTFKRERKEREFFEPDNLRFGELVKTGI